MRTATGMHPDALKRLAGAVSLTEYSRKFDTGERQKAEKDGHAMPGGRYPVYTQEDLDNAVEDYYMHGRPSSVAAHIHAMAKKLGLKLPSDMADS